MTVVNLALRFALELAALAAFAAWGLDATGGPARFVLAAATVGVAVLLRPRHHDLVETRLAARAHAAGGRVRR
jgi:hypothetical protein